MRCGLLCKTNPIKPNLSNGRAGSCYILMSLDDIGVSPANSRCTQRRFVVDYTYQWRYNRGGFKEVTVVAKAEHNEQFDDDIPQSKADILRAKDIMPPFNANSAESSEAGGPQQKAEIPKFDLAEEIMAEHRKVTAVKRKSPSQKTESQQQKTPTESIRHIIPPRHISQKQMQIIAEIVARDIERLCKGASQNQKIML